MLTWNQSYCQAQHLMFSRNICQRFAVGLNRFLHSAMCNWNLWFNSICIYLPHLYPAFLPIILLSPILSSEEPSVADNVWLVQSQPANFNGRGGIWTCIDSPAHLPSGILSLPTQPNSPRQTREMQPYLEAEIWSHSSGWVWCTITAEIPCCPWLPIKWVGFETFLG